MPSLYQRNDTLRSRFAVPQNACINSSIPLPPTAWNSRVSDGHPGYITVHHFTLATARVLPGFLEYLGAIFAKEIADGMTYPQENMGQENFESYFFFG